jgi:nucleotide-binding universal stress UspA family protein
MRVLIGYNGTEFARSAIGEMTWAGMPDRADAMVLTVAEMCYPTVARENAEAIAEQGEALVKAMFPNWSIERVTKTGSPVCELLEAAETFNAEIIVLGEPGKGDPKSNGFLGPVSQGLLTDGTCSLRISRSQKGGEKGDAYSPRLLVGYDGSEGAERALSVIAGRHWPANTAVRLLSIDDTGILGSIGRLSPLKRVAEVGLGFTTQWAETLAAPALKRLREAGLNASIEIGNGNPKNALIDAADDWNADSIFVSPHCAGNSYERFLLGSVSASVAANANCTVEIVR